MSLTLPKINRTGTTPSRKRFWDNARETLLGLQKVAGRNVTVDEHKGKGTFVNVVRSPGAAPPPTCECPRDVTEISGYTLSGTATITPCPDCGEACSTLTCDFSVTWTRINHADSYSAPHQFKLYVDAPCDNTNGGTFYFESNDSDPPDAIECYIEGEFYGSFGIDWLHASISSGPPFLVGNTTPPAASLGFTVEGDGGCFFDTCTADVSETDIPVTICDVSAIIGTYTASNTVTDGIGSTMEVSGQLDIF